jgi:hypothetical protein
MAEDFPGVALLEYRSSRERLSVLKYTNLQLVLKEKIFPFVVPDKANRSYTSLFIIYYAIKQNKTGR